MFSSEDPIKLRESLAPIEFSGTSNLGEIAQAYCQHYGLRFDQNLQLESHRIGTLRSRKFDLVCQYFSVPLYLQRGTVFLVHGYFDHAGLYGHLIKHCLQQGLAVIIFDLPGHGLSSGEKARIESPGPRSGDCGSPLAGAVRAASPPARSPRSGERCTPAIRTSKYVRLDRNRRSAPPVHQ